MNHVDLAGDEGFHQLRPGAKQLGLFDLQALFLVKALPGNADKRQQKYFLLAAVFTGLGMLSKYTTVFLWAGALAYIVTSGRLWLKKPVFYFAHLVIVILFLPVLIWNAQNNFISFSFHGSRVEPLGAMISYNSFLRELAGEILYTNPLVWVLIILSLAAFFRKKKNGDGASGSSRHGKFC